jgi:hypothetical protein
MKKNLFKISVAFLSIILAGCLDDEKYALDPSETNNVIEFYDASVPTNPAGAVYPVWTTTTEIIPTFTFEQEISFSGPNGNSSDIELTLAVDPFALDEYNAQMLTELNGATYEMMPPTYYEFTDVAATIPSGETRTSISITVFPEQFDLTKNWALPIRIVSASKGVLSAHFSVAIMAVVIKNKYDGVYEILGGSITRNSASGPDLALGGNYVDDLEVEFATINGTSCGWAPLWKEGSGVGGVGGTNTVVDEVTNLTTTTATGNASLKNTPATINEFFPGPGADQTGQEFMLNFDWGAAPNTRIIADFNIMWTGPRP